MTFLQKPEGGERVSQADLWERAFQAEGTAGAKALGWVRCPICLKNGKTSTVAGEAEQNCEGMRSDGTQTVPASPRAEVKMRVVP